MSKPWKDQTPEERERTRARKRRWKAANPDKVRESKRRFVSRRRLRDPDYCKRRYKQTKERRRVRETARRYKLSDAEYALLVEQSGGSCAICGLPEKLVVDHCHSTGIVRGLICGSCNKGLGGFRDSEEALDRAITYLQISRANGRGQ